MSSFVFRIYQILLNCIFFTLTWPTSKFRLALDLSTLFRWRVADRADQVGVFVNYRHIVPRRVVPFRLSAEVERGHLHGLATSRRRSSCVVCGSLLTASATAATEIRQAPCAARRISSSWYRHSVREVIHLHCCFSTRGTGSRPR